MVGSSRTTAPQAEPYVRPDHRPSRREELVHGTALFGFDVAEAGAINADTVLYHVEFHVRRVAAFRRSVDTGMRKNCTPIAAQDGSTLGTGSRSVPALRYAVYGPPRLVYSARYCAASCFC